MEKLIFAHRGAGKIEHENTLKAFQKALDLGVDGIELDLQKTADGRLAVFHDEQIASKKISQLSLEEINSQALKLNFRVPELADALNLIAGKAKLQIVIKEQGYEQDVVASALKVLLPEDFTIISFHAKSLQIIKKFFPHVKTGLIIGTKHGRITQILLFALNRNKYLTFTDMFSINWKLWLAGFVKLIPSNYPLSVWTADGTALIKSLLSDDAVSGIVSNYPDRALLLKKEYEQK